MARSSEQADDLPRILKIIHAKHRVSQRPRLRFWQGLDRKFHELLHNVLLAGKGLFAAARRLERFLVYAAVIQMNLDPHLVTETGAKCSDLLVLDAFDFSRKRDPSFIMHAARL